MPVSVGRTLRLGLPLCDDEKLEKLFSEAKFEASKLYGASENCIIS